MARTRARISTADLEEALDYLEGLVVILDHFANERREWTNLTRSWRASRAWIARAIIGSRSDTKQVRVPAGNSLLRTSPRCASASWRTTRRPLYEIDSQVSPEYHEASSPESQQWEMPLTR